MSSDNWQPMTDAGLLDVYASRQDEAAFRELMRRHSALVYRACLRVLKDAHEAEDAAQAVFVALARQAGGLRRGNLSGWLYRVAHNVAAEIVRKRMHRTTREQAYAENEARQAGEPLAADAASPAVLELLDRALLTLPERYREAVILRYLQNHSQEDAARLAGCPLGTLSRRASEGLARLRRSLTALGAPTGVATLTGILVGEAAAPVPATVFAAILATVKTGAGAATATATGSAQALTLAKSALKTLFWAKVKTATITTAASLAVVAAGGLAMHQALAHRARVTPAVTAPAAATITNRQGPRHGWNPLDRTLEIEFGGELEIIDPQDQHRNRKLTLGTVSRLIRLADGRLLGLEPVSAGVAPVEVQPQARTLGPPATTPIRHVRMTAADAAGHYLLAAVGSERTGGRLLIWDLERQTLAADLADLPRTPHPDGDYGWLFCAVAPDGTSGAVVDSGGGLLILALPAGTVQHRVTLPTPKAVLALGRDLAWEDGQLVCRGWPAANQGTIFIAPQTGAISERFDHPVFRRGPATIHVHSDRIAVEGAAARPLHPIGRRQQYYSSGAWRCSADGAFLASVGWKATERPDQASQTLQVFAIGTGDYLSTGRGVTVHEE